MVSYWPYHLPVRPVRLQHLPRSDPLRHALRRARHGRWSNDGQPHVRLLGGAAGSPATPAAECPSASRLAASATRQEKQRWSATHAIPERFKAIHEQLPEVEAPHLVVR